MTQNANPALIVFDGSPLQIEQINAIAHARSKAVLSSDPAFRSRIQRGADFLAIGKQ